MTRDYPERPIVGVAAVVIEDDRVVLVRRGRPPAYGEWSLPGGAVEPGESLEEAVVREVAEEIGLKVEVVEVVAVLDDSGQAQHLEHGAARADHLPARQVLRRPALGDVRSRSARNPGHLPPLHHPRGE